ncbi:MAG: hypothetical protein KL840_01325 [Aquamicrobium sp.]|nr:hypothetical protein [Aquamicrobium sp.]
MTREKMTVELKRLVQSQAARDLYLRRSNKELAAAIERLKDIQSRTDRMGHIAATGHDLRLVERD